MSTPIELNLELFAPDSARAVIGQYEHSAELIGARVAAVCAIEANYPTLAVKIAKMADALLVETIKRADITNPHDIETLRIVINDLVVAGYANNNDLQPKDEFDLMTKAVRGILF